MSERARYLTLSAGPFRLALPLHAIKQILDVGGFDQLVPYNPADHGVVPVSLARALGRTPLGGRPAYVLCHRGDTDVVLAACALGDVLDVADKPRPLPATVVCRWPGLMHGIIRDPKDGGLRLVLDSVVLGGLLEAA